MRIECRPFKANRIAMLCTGVFLALVAMGCIIGSFYDTPSGMGEWLTLAFVVGSCGGFATYALCFYFRLAVVADEEGLRWRSLFGPWKAAGWDEISNFYLFEDRKETARVIETSHGILRIGTDYSGAPNARELDLLQSLTNLISKKATNISSRIKSAEDGHTADGWPSRFIYFTEYHKTFPRQAVLAAAGIVGVTIYFYGRYFLYLQTDTDREIFTDIPLIWRIGMILFPLSPAILSSWLAMIVRTEKKEVLPRRDELVEISPAGIVFEGQQKIAALWSDVQSIAQNFSTESLKFTTGKGSFEIHYSLTNFLEFSRLVEKYAPELTKDWLVDELKVEKSYWSGGKAGEGAQIFHYRHRASRLLLIAGLLIFLAPLLSIIGPAPVPEDSPNHVSIYVLLPFIGGGLVLWIYGCVAYFKTEIWVDDNGLRLYSVFRKRHILWSEIDGYGIDSNGYFIDTDGRKFRFSNGLRPVRIHVLERLISRNTPHVRGNWERRIAPVRALKPHN